MKATTKAEPSKKDSLDELMEVFSSKNNQHFAPSSTQNNHSSSIKSSITIEKYANLPSNSEGNSLTQPGSSSYLKIKMSLNPVASIPTTSSTNPNKYHSCLQSSGSNNVNILREPDGKREVKNDMVKHTAATTAIPRPQKQTAQSATVSQGIAGLGERDIMSPRPHRGGNDQQNRKMAVFLSIEDDDIGFIKPTI